MVSCCCQAAAEEKKVQHFWLQGRGSAREMQRLLFIFVSAELHVKEKVTWTFEILRKNVDLSIDLL